MPESQDLHLHRPPQNTTTALKLAEPDCQKLRISVCTGGALGTGFSQISRTDSAASKFPGLVILNPRIKLEPLNCPVLLMPGTPTEMASSNSTVCGLCAPCGSNRSKAKLESETSQHVVQAHTAADALWTVSPAERATVAKRTEDSGSSRTTEDWCDGIV